MSESPTKFADLLGQALWEIKAHTGKPIAAAEDELNIELNKSAAINHYRRGNVPSSLDDLGALAKGIVRRGGLRNYRKLERFLTYGGHPYPRALCDELLPVPVEQNLSQELMSRNMELAPFVAGPPITHPRQFFGREWEVKRIFDLWKRFPLQNVAVIGLQRSGKTSLLHYLKSITMIPSTHLRSGQRTAWLPRPDHYRWVLVDFQDDRMCTEKGLLHHLLGGLEIPIPDQCDLHNFVRVVSAHLKTPALILMDEIGAALASPELNQRFWWSLRSLATNQTKGLLGFLLTCQRLPKDVAGEYDKPSPFFNIFGHTVSLRPFSEQEAYELIASSPKPFDSVDVEWILVQSGRWPALLQILCYERLQALEDGEAGDVWKKRGLRQMEPFKYLLEGH